jgi:hypothetical protein
MPDDEKYDFLLKLLKDELAAQANVFDQIDNKTGVALGFTFVAVGQVLASVFRMATDQNHFHTLHSSTVGSVFLMANMSVLLAIIFGATARWPRSFEHSMEWSDDALDDSPLEIKKRAVNVLQEITKTNDKTNEQKGLWAKATYLCVGFALLFYLALTVLLYVYSIPK